MSVQWTGVLSAMEGEVPFGKLGAYFTVKSIGVHFAYSVRVAVPSSPTGVPARPRPSAKVIVVLTRPAEKSLFTYQPPKV